MAYHTNATVYISKNEETARITQEIIDDNQGISHPLARRNIKDYKDYKIKENFHHHQLQKVTLIMPIVTN